MILYFSGKGNSAYTAQKIAENIQDDTLDLFQKIRDSDHTQLCSDKPWVIVSPTYAWRIPRILQDWLTKTKLAGNKDIYFILTCGGNIGNAGAYIKKLCTSKNLNFKGCVPVLMPENYIALFRAPQEEESLEIIRRAEDTMDQISHFITNNEMLPQPSLTSKDRLNSGIVNNIFYPAFVHARKFYTTNACISCGKCEKVCPLKNVHLEKGKPVWGSRCTHCMACICRCPVEAIEYGQHTKGLSRYVFPKSIKNK